MKSDEHTEDTLTGSDGGVKRLNESYFFEFTATFQGPFLAILFSTILACTPTINKVEIFKQRSE